MPTLFVECQNCGSEAPVYEAHAYCPHCKFDGYGFVEEQEDDEER